jgi:hypothetical protein
VFANRRFALGLTVALPTLNACAALAGIDQYTRGSNCEGPCDAGTADVTAPAFFTEGADAARDSDFADLLVAANDVATHDAVVGASTDASGLVDVDSSEPPTSPTIAPTPADAGVDAQTVSMQTGAVEASSNPFVGVWSCTETQTLTYAGDRGGAVVTSTEPCTLTITGTPDDLTVVTAPQGGTMCTLHLTWSGSMATLVAGQSCPYSSSSTLVTTLTSGSAAVNGNTLIAGVMGTIAGPLGLLVEGNLMVSQSCTKT